MASAFTHVAAAAAIGSAFWRPGSSARFWIVGMTCAIVPDFDVLGLPFRIPYGSMFGHRGITHSLAFAAVLALVAAPLCRTNASSPTRWWSWWFLFVATASHGFLDAMTSGGWGIAFFAPFSNERFFFPWRPLVVSPIGTAFFSRWGVDVLRSEFIWVWIPGAIC